jgi:predicted TIM-barrel fold metal-dependent hydrolase
MQRPIDVNFRAVDVADEFELVASVTIAARIAPRLEQLADNPPAARLLTPPVYYSLAGGIDDNREINDALIAAAREIGTRAFGIAEPKYGDIAAAEIERLATLGAAGVVWSPRAQGIFGNDHSLAELIRLADRLGLISMIQSAPYSVNEGLWRLWSLSALCGDIPLIILGALESWENIQLIRDRKGGSPSLYYDLSAMSEGYDLDQVVVGMGADRLLLGSGGGDGITATLGVIERSTLSTEAIEAILWRNASRLFGMTELPE